MKYSLIDRSKAPNPQARTTNKRTQLTNEIVGSLVPGKVAKVELTGNETIRGTKAAITRAAKRLGRNIRTWDSNGVVYAELAGTQTEAGQGEEQAE